MFDRVMNTPLSPALLIYCGQKRHGEKKSVDFYDQKIFTEFQIALSPTYNQKALETIKGSFVMIFMASEVGSFIGRMSY